MTTVATVDGNVAIMGTTTTDLRISALQSQRRQYDGGNTELSTQIVGGYLDRVALDFLVPSIQSFLKLFAADDDAWISNYYSS